MNKATVIGHFGFGQQFLDGQTVKTKIITEELKNRLGEGEVYTIDTHGGLKTLVKAPFQVLRALKKSKNVLIFPAHNGLKVFGRLLPLLRPFFKGRRIHYVVIGGWLASFLKDKKGLAKALKRFDGIYVETNTMKKALEEQGFENIYVMPNCKRLTVLAEDELVYPTEAPYKLCTFSRVMKEKGIETAVNVIKNVNDRLGYTAYSLDIYGQVDSSQTEWFKSLKQSFPYYINYGGLVPFDESVNVLKNYFALLFPTYYDGEGFAGTLIDAFSAGVPVVASDWKYNAEIVSDATGFVYETHNDKALTDLLLLIIDTPSLMTEKKRNCLDETQKYKIENVISVLTDRLDV